jgi:UDP-3-O-[3-hydroxymyristoyl] N-acetylglucosamine deacetylase
VTPSCGRGQAAGGKGAAELEPGGAKFLKMRQQRTLRQAIGCAGVGLHSGARVAVTLRPAAEGSGIRFRRVDRPGSPGIAALPCHARAIDGVVCLVGQGGGTVRMIEHLMAALAACGIDNILVEISGAELPAMDGSALPFVRLIECAGTVEQARPVARLEVLQPIEAVSAEGFARLEPASELVLSLSDDVAGGLPASAATSAPDWSMRDLVSAREPACIEDGCEARAEETSRHQMLDALGGLALVPAHIEGRYIEHHANATLRCALLQALVSDRDSYMLAGIERDVLQPPTPAVLLRAS